MVRVQLRDVVFLPPFSEIEVAPRAVRGAREAVAGVRAVVFRAVDGGVFGEYDAGSAVAHGGAGVAGRFERFDVVVFAGHRSSFSWRGSHVLGG
jgi:hypothetical protein